MLQVESPVVPDKTTPVDELAGADVVAEAIVVEESSSPPPLPLPDESSLVSSPPY